METKTVATVDQALPLIGEIGLHQILVLAILCVLTIPATFQALIIFFLAHNPDWRCVANSTVCKLTEVINSSNVDNYTFRCNIPRKEWEYLEETKYSIVTEFGLYCGRENLKFVATSLFFLGMAIGSIVLGWIADKHGRAKLIIPCTIGAIGIAFLSSFSPTYWVFAITRFVIGFLAPGITVMFFVLASEIVGPKYRPAAGIILWFFFTVALVLLGIVAMYVREWKMLMIYSTAPYFILLPLLFFVPESLRWLHVTGQLQRANAILKRVGNINGKNTEVHLSPANVTQTKINPLLLFSTTDMMLKSINIGFAWMVNGLVYYGISLAIDDLSGHMYRDFILSSLVEFPACIIAILGSMYMGRKYTTQVPMFLGGICCACVAAIKETETDQSLITTRVALGLTGKFFLTLSYDTIYTWTVELYPTQIRTEGIGYVQITSRLGAMLSPWIAKWLIQFHWRLPFLVMGILAIVSSIFLCWMPETRNEKTAEIYVDPTVNDQSMVLLTDVDTPGK